MVTICRQDDNFIFEADGVETHDLAFWEKFLAKLWSFKKRLEIPRAHVRGAQRDPAIAESYPGLFTPVLGGTSVPGRFAYGTFLQDGRRVFWDVRHPKNAVRIDLEHEHFDELIVEVANPEDAVRLLTS